MAKIQDFLEPLFPDLNLGFTLVLVTITFSTAIGFLLTIIAFTNHRNLSKSLFLFIYSFLGCCAGGVLGSVMGLILGTIFAAFTPIGDGLMGGLSGIGVGLVIFDTIIIFWLIGIFTGGIVAATQLIKSFSDE